MIRRFWFFLIIPLAVLASQCTTIQCGTNTAQFLEQFDDFMMEVRESEMHFNDPKWLIYDDQFETYLTSCYIDFKEELTQGDRQQVIAQGFRYYYTRYGSHMISELNNTANPTSGILKDEMREIWQSDHLLRELADEDWDIMMSEILNDLEALKNRLKDLMEEQEQ